MTKLLLLMFMLVSAVTQAQYQNLTANGWRYANNYDPMAEALFTAVEAEGVTITTGAKSDINDWFVTAQGRSYWPKIIAFWGFVFADADGNKYNWVDPQDADGSYRITWHGGWTHSSTGADPNGTDGYADMHIVPSSDMTLNNTSVGLYTRTTQSGASVADIGCYDGGDNPRLSMEIDWGGNFATDQYTYLTGRVSTTAPTSTGLFTSTRTNGSTFKAFRGNTQLGSTNTGSSGGSLPTITMFLAAANNGGSACCFSNKELGGAFAAEGFTDSEVDEFNTDFEALMDAFGMGVQ